MRMGGQISVTHLFDHYIFMENYFDSLKGDMVLAELNDRLTALHA